MQSAKARGSPKESPKKTPVQLARLLKINSVGPSSPSPSGKTVAKTPKDRSPKVAECKSPRTPISEKKRPSKLSELESQISKLQDDVQKVKDQLEDAEEAKRQLADVSSKLEDSQKQLYQLHASKEENTVVNLQINLEEMKTGWEAQFEAVRKQHLLDSAALTSALDEIQSLKLQLEKVSASGDSTQVKQSETTQAELQSLKDNLNETLSVLESMKQDLEKSRESEAEAQDLVRETLSQLKAAKETVDSLRSDIIRSTDAYNAFASELEQSRARVFYLEGIVEGLKADLNASATDQILPEDVNQLQVELKTAKSDVRQLKSALEAAEIRCNEERSHCSSQIGNASELLEKVKEQSSLREAELEVELKKARSDIEDLKAHLMDKETELQGISEDNESLNVQLRMYQLKVEDELNILKEHFADLRARSMDKETELQSLSEEDEILKLEISNQEDTITAEVDASRAAEQDAVTKLGYMMEEVDKSNKKAARVAEQLEAAQAANGEMEAELRRLKVQSDQWRKAAEAAATMLSPSSDGKYLERTGSMPVGKRRFSPFLDDYDDESFKKKNGNVLKKIGVLWKNPQKWPTKTVTEGTFLSLKL